MAMKRCLLKIALLILLQTPQLGADGMKLLYPVPYVLFQRDTVATGEIRLRGAYPTAVDPERIEARFNGGKWRVIDAKPQQGTFAGRMRVRVGQGALEVRATGAPNMKVVVDPVAVGDLFVITGQSNADGRGDAHIQLGPTNPCLGVKYCGNTWSKGDDPSANDGQYGSPWPIVLNDLIPEQKVPMGFLQAAVGSTVVKQWRKGGDLYARMLKLIEVATDGSMAIKAVFYYQGENDITHWNSLSVLGDYDEYKQNLLAAATDFGNDLHAPFIVGQITNLGSERGRNDNMRRAQQEIWKEHPNVRQGAVTYDILPTDGVHYRDEANMRAFARRWTLAIRTAVYGRRDCAPPNLKSAERVEATTVRLVFDRKLKIERWDGTPGVKASGFRFRDGEVTLGDGNVV
ncbi:MAG: hypothetical protein HY318_17250, partial [Armatimonadetes bacterium]|nr:hypothetical protein [Armatimonadota bacterium]